MQRLWQIAILLLFILHLVNSTSSPTKDIPASVIIYVDKVHDGACFRNCLRSLHEEIQTGLSGSTNHEATKEDSLTHPSILVQRVLVVLLGSLDNPNAKFQRKSSVLYSIEAYHALYLATNVEITLIENPQGQDWNIYEAIDSAVNYTKTHDNSSDHYMMVLSEKSQVLPRFFQSMESAMTEFPDARIFGGKIIQGNGLLYHAGIDFGLTKTGKKNPSWRRGPTTTEEKNGVMPYFKYQGRFPFEDRDWLAGSHVVDAISPVTAMFSRSVHEDYGFNRTYNVFTFSFIDFCLRVQHGTPPLPLPEQQQDNSTIEIDNTNETTGPSLLPSTHSVVLNPNAVTMYFGDIENLNNEDDQTQFNAMWYRQLSKKIRDGFVIRNYTLVWNMECGKGQVLGFTTEAIGFLQSLEGKVLLKIQVGSLSSCVDDMASLGLPSSTLRMLERLHEVVIEGDSVLVVHRDPGRYSSFISQFPNKDNLVYVIGRSMYETDSVPSNWVSKCNGDVDAIWVPSQFNVETFSKSGVESSLLEVLPEPLDTHLFNPDIYNISKFGGKMYIQQYIESHANIITLPEKSRFNFLTLMKFEKRKGWDTLLTSYYDEFRRSDDVTLYLRSNMDDKNMKEFETFQNLYLLENEGRNESSLPKVVFLKEQLPYPMLPFLYSKVDCFVLPTHGEGWGLPIIEAMAMGLPTISTNWSGSTEFMTSENSFLIPVEKMVPASTADHLWAQPSAEQLKVAMRYVYENRDESQQVARRARQDALKYSHTEIGEKVLEKLKKIEEDIPKFKIEGTNRTKKRASATETVAPSSASSSSKTGDAKASSGKHQIKIVQNET